MKKVGQTGDGEGRGGEGKGKEIRCGVYESEEHGKRARIFGYK